MHRFVRTFSFRRLWVKSLIYILAVLQMDIEIEGIEDCLSVAMFSAEEFPEIYIYYLLDLRLL